MLDRHFERTRLDDLLRRIRAGRSATAVLVGGAGVGKTVLLEYLVDSADGAQILTVTGIQAEVELSYSALHQLCRPLLGSLSVLPRPQQEALEITFGMRAGTMPDIFLIGLATLTLLSDASAVAPLLCVIDDAQWLDANSAQVLGFVARRLEEEAVAMVFAVRSGRDPQGLDGIPRIGVSGLAKLDARQLITSLAPGPVDPRALQRIVDESEGNPLVLVESARAMSPAEIATGLILRSRPARPSELEEHFRRLLQMLPTDSQQLLLLAAAEPFADARTISTASRQLGIDQSAVRPAIEAELCEPGETVRFRHPLVRSAVYRNASPDELRRVHGALAVASPASTDPVLLAWHRAQASEGANEDAAIGLAEAADRVLTRGGPAASAELLRQALTVTSDKALTLEWRLRLAQRELSAGEYEHANRNIQALATADLKPELRAQAKLLEARLTFARARGGAAIPLLLQAADQLASINSQAAKEAFLEALSAALFGGRLSRAGGLSEVARRWRKADLPLGERPADQLLAAMANVISDNAASSWKRLHNALSDFRSAAEADDGPVPWLWLACVAAAAAWDFETWDALSTRHVSTSRLAGDYSELPIALSSRTFVPLFAGDLDAASDTVQEMATITAATGGAVSPYGAIGVAAMRGQEEVLRELVSSAIPAAEKRSDATGVAIACWGAALLDNSLGRYESAAGWGARAVELHHSLHSTTAWALVELVEAASRSNRTDTATAALEQLEIVAQSSGTEWALGVLARSKALAAFGSDAEELYVEALRRLEPTLARIDVARASLVYGEWLRRQKRLADARIQLSRSHDMFESMGAFAFAARAAAELRATGANLKGAGSLAPFDLTAQEFQIARLASQGLTNAEVAARMFLSPRTVEYHLGKIFSKLQIDSRHRIAGAIARLLPVGTATGENPGTAFH